jgi:hypothetical protein
MVGASIQRLRETVKTYRNNGEFEPLLTIVRDLYKMQGMVESNSSYESVHNVLKREDLHLVCYEYIDG